jgi:hypothetical protein
LPDSVRGALRERATGHRMGEYGYEPVIDGFELAQPVDEAERNEARIITAAALRPSPVAVIQGELGRLRMLTAKKADQAVEAGMQAALYAEMLAEYPEDIVVRVCRDWLKDPKGEFWPAWAELGGPADRLLKERRDLAEALAACGPKPPPEPDPEDIERRRLIAARDRQWTEAAAHRDAHPELMQPRPAPPRPEGEKPMRSIGDLAAGFHLPDVDDPEVQRWLAAMEATE